MLDSPSKRRDPALIPLCKFFYCVEVPILYSLSFTTNSRDSRHHCHRCQLNTFTTILNRNSRVYRTDYHYIMILDRTFSVMNSADNKYHLSYVKWLLPAVWVSFIINAPCLTGYFQPPSLLHVSATPTFMYMYGLQHFP